MHIAEVVAAGTAALGRAALLRALRVYRVRAGHVQGYGVKEWRSWLRHLTNKRDKLRQQHLDDYLRDDRWPTEVSQVESDLVAAEWDRGGRAANDEYELQRRKRTLSWLAGRANGYSAARRVLTVNT